MIEAISVALALATATPNQDLVFEKPKPVVVKIELTLQEKIKTNFYKCSDLEWIRADNARCKPKTGFVAQKGVTQAVNSSHNLIGTLGYALPYGNCVDEPGVNSPRNGTNPISWTVLSYTPTIGATALWAYNHTGVVTGIWGNGDIEVRHQNYSGGQTRFPRSAFRGFR